MLPESDLTVYSDTQSLFGACTLLSQTTEHRLHTDLSLLQEAYENRNITNTVWIAGNDNLADDLTKPDKRNAMLAIIVETNHFRSKENSSILRDASTAIPMVQIKCSHLKMKHV